MNTNSTEQSTQAVYDAVRREQGALDRQVENDFQLLRGISISLLEFKGADETMLDSVVDKINRSNDFVRMGIAGPDGKVTLFDIDGSVYPGVDVSGEEFFRRAMKGEEYVSTTVHSLVADEYVNCYGVPIEEGGEVTGVLVAANPARILNDLAREPLFRGQGQYVILDKTGTIIGPVADSGAVFQDGASIFDYADFSEDDLPRFHWALQTGTYDSFSPGVDGRAQVAAMAPLNINDWFVMGLVPESALSGYYNQTALGVTIIIVCACAIFLFLMYLQRKTMTRNQKTLEHIAYTDLLTGRLNYTKFLIDAAGYFEDHPGGGAAVFSLDIKRLKTLNDIYGAHAGDTVIKLLSECLGDASGAGALICRISADNFAGVLPFYEKTELEHWFHTVQAGLTRQEFILEAQIHPQLAAGFYCPGDFAEQPLVRDMVNRAVIAKNTAKERAGSACAFFTAQMSEVARREAELETAGKTALENGEISFYLQPKVSIQDGYHVAGAEALARWHSPVFGHISPAEFVPVFEKNGMIVQLDRYIFEAACKWYRAYLDAGLPPINLAINVSRLGMMRDDFLDYYSAVRDRYDLKDATLELEFTESVVFEDYDRFVSLVERLQRNGFVCSIDDFGSGYSSLNVLKNLPIYVLKLDAAFFRNSKDIVRERAVIAHFINMAKELRIRTIAEGVEDAERVDFLRAAGADVVQGYVFSKPLPYPDFQALMETTGGVLQLPGRGDE